MAGGSAEHGEITDTWTTGILLHTGSDYSQIRLGEQHGERNGMDNVETARVLLVEEQTMFRQVIASYINELPNLRIVADVGTARDARQIADEHDVDLAIIDVVLPDSSGLDLVKELKSLYLPIKTILLTTLDNEDTLIESVNVGADGYVVKSGSLEQLMETVRTVLAGQCYYEPLLCSSAIRKLVGANKAQGDDEQARLPGLTARQCQVIDLLAKGLTNKEIAQELGISVSTTKTHVANAFKHLGVSSRRELLPRFYRLAALTKAMVPPGHD